MLTKPRVRQWLEERFFLRWHMTIILGGTFLAGLVMTRVLMLGGVNNLAVRYVVAVGAAYLAFLVLIRLWLMYVGSGHTIDVDLVGDGADIADVLSSGNAPHFHGGGSSGSWSAPDLDVGGDLEDLVVLVILGVIVVCLCGFAIYFIYTAPALLSEAAFEAALAAALARRTRNATGPGWIGAVWRATIWPFAIVLVLSGLLGWAAQRACPTAKRLSEALSCASQAPR